MIAVDRANRGESKRKCEVSYLAERLIAVRYAHFTSALMCESR